VGKERDRAGNKLNRASKETIPHDYEKREEEWVYGKKRQPMDNFSFTLFVPRGDAEIIISFIKQIFKWCREPTRILHNDICID
jgi:hypothetical protein